MNKRSIIILAAAVLLVAATKPAAAQVRWGRGRLPGAGACFYKDNNFRGEYFCTAPGQTLAALPGGMGDKISSIRVLGETEVTIFRDQSFRGRSSHFRGNIPDLKREGWNDAISSIRIDRTRGGGGFGGGPVWGRGPVPREGACFYEDSEFRGRYFCINRGRDARSLPAGFNDKISSIRVFFGRVELFADDDFHGRKTRVDRDVPKLGSWGDKISSLKVF